MYCVNCGVELASSERVCPLCGIRAYHPDLGEGGKGALPYPKALPLQKRVRPRGVIFVIAMALFVLMAVLFVCDVSMSGGVSWSGYTTGGLLLAYILLVLPFWFAHRNPVIWVPVDFLAVGLYMLYIDLVNQGGWFLSFAFPVIGALGLIVSAAVALLYYMRRGHLFVLGGSALALGGLLLLVEFLADYTFGMGDGLFTWSLYPLITLVVCGIMLLIIAICRPLREALSRKMFI